MLSKIFITNINAEGIFDLTLNLTPHKEINSKWVMDLKTKQKVIELLERKEEKIFRV